METNTQTEFSTQELQLLYTGLLTRKITIMNLLRAWYKQDPDNLDETTNALKKLYMKEQGSLTSLMNKDCFAQFSL